MVVGETWIDCRKALHKQHCAELLFHARTCSKGQSVGILPNYTRTAGSTFSLLSPHQLLILTTGLQITFCQWSASCTIPTWGPRPPIPQGGNHSDGHMDWKVSVSCWHWVNRGLELSGSALVWPEKTERRDQQTDVWALTTQVSTGHLVQRPVEVLLLSMRLNAGCERWHKLCEKMWKSCICID